jgi:hypothetical protein
LESTIWSWRGFIVFAISCKFAKIQLSQDRRILKSTKKCINKELWYF